MTTGLRAELTFCLKISTQTLESVSRWNEKFDSKEHEVDYRAIMKWLPDIDFSTRQAEFIHWRQPETGGWFQESTEFQRWVAPNNTDQILFCPRILGAGKTIIAPIVVHELSIRVSSNASIGIAYIFFDFRHQKYHKPDDLMASILEQLSQTQNSVLEPLKALYERYESKQTRPSFSELCSVLRVVASALRKVFIVIDALDECQASLRGRDQFLFGFFELQEATGCNLFLASGFIPEIAKEFEGELSLEICAREGDIMRYVEGRMPRLLRQRITRYPDVQKSIQKEILAAVDGMYDLSWVFYRCSPTKMRYRFLLAELHTNALETMRTVGDIKNAVKSLLRGLESLDVTYEQAVGRIDGQEADFRTLAIQVLSWVTHTCRPLSGLEIRHTLELRADMTEFDEDFLPEMEDLISSCAGLVKMDKESDIFRVVHNTTQTFFKKTWKCWFPDAQTNITIICVTYLSFKTFESGFCCSKFDYERRLQIHVLYEYAATYWGKHAGYTSTSETEAKIVDFLES